MNQLNRKISIKAKTVLIDSLKRKVENSSLTIILKKFLVEMYFFVLKQVNQIQSLYS